MLAARGCLAFLAPPTPAGASGPAHAAPGGGGDTVQGLYDALLSTMKNGRTLGKSGRFTQLEPVIHRSFDIPLMARLSVGSSWATLSEAQRQQVTESFERYISAIVAVDEGLELNILGLNIGVDAAMPALKLPAIGRLGLDR